MTYQDDFTLSHERIADHLKASIYFAHPNSAWEQNSNENMNDLLRHYFPKDRDLPTISDEDMELVMFSIKNRPRKIT